MTSIDYILIVVTCLLAIADVVVMAIQTTPNEDVPKPNEEDENQQ